MYQRSFPPPHCPGTPLWNSCCKAAYCPSAVVGSQLRHGCYPGPNTRSPSLPCLSSISPPLGHPGQAGHCCSVGCCIATRSQQRRFATTHRTAACKAGLATSVAGWHSWIECPIFALLSFGSPIERIARLFVA